MTKILNVVFGTFLASCALVKASGEEGLIIKQCLNQLALLDQPVTIQEKSFGENPVVEMFSYQKLGFKTLVIYSYDNFNFLSCNILDKNQEVFYLTINFRNNQSLLWRSEKFEEMDQSIFYDADKYESEVGYKVINTEDFELLRCIESFSINKCLQ